jgi:DNA-directed RNA polymerase sigma subunit (sigma70/sigma32)
MYWIRSAVKRSQTFQSRIISLPQRLHANHKRIQIIQQQLRFHLGRPPTHQEWARAAQMSERQLHRCIQAMEQQCYSLDQPIRYSNSISSSSSSSSSSLSSLSTRTSALTPSRHDQESTLYDVVESFKGSTHGRNTRRTSLPQNLLREALIETLYRTLDQESAQLLLLRFGLVDPDILPEGWEGPLTIAQVSQLVGKKPDKVRRQILKSLNDLKCAMGNDWKDFDTIVEG